MDFQSAMDTFVEAWVAAKTDQVQVILFISGRADRHVGAIYY